MIVKIRSFLKKLKNVSPRGGGVSPLRIMFMFFGKHIFIYLNIIINLLILKYLYYTYIYLNTVAKYHAFQTIDHRYIEYSYKNMNIIIYKSINTDIKIKKVSMISDLLNFFI